MSHPRAIAEVDLSAITENVRTLRALVNVPVMTVVKADAYGHGLVPVSRAAIEGGASWLGVALLEEALAIRASGITIPVLSWLTPPHDRFAEAITADVDLSVASVAAIEEIASVARGLGASARIHVEVDTGMTRGGTLQDIDVVFDAVAKAATAGDVQLVGIWSHLACADQPGSPKNAEQQQRFDAALALAQSKGLRPQLRHLANSAATLNDPSLHYDLVRCGIATYGLSPDLEGMGPATQWGLRPAMRLKARLALVKRVPAGAEVSYGGTYVTSEETTLGIIPLGYADGIPRHGSGRLHVASSEGIHPIRGRVCMDQIVMECGPASALQAGDEVLLFGPEGPTADLWGHWAGTIGYEIVTRLGPRVPRVYI